MDVQYVAEVIRESVSAIDVAQALGLRVDMHHRCPCPFHGGEHNNLRLYDGSRGYYCFVCHAWGSCIDLVKEVNGCGFMDAARWINDTFGLGLNLDERSMRNRTRKAQRVAGRMRKDKA